MSLTETQQTPAKMLANYLLANNMTQDDAAAKLKTSRFSVNYLINNKRTITAAMAIKLERLTGIPARTWMYAQVELDLQKCKIKARTK